MSPLPELVRRKWPDLHGPGVVAVSGGADSVALLRVLATWIDPLIPAHLNHRLRGKESDADEQFVRDLSASLGLTCRTLAIDIAEENHKVGGNLEDTARRIRYEFLGGVAREAGANWVATGHTADDQAETVMHRLLRGSGIRGLRGIAADRALASDIRLIRPLLAAKRGDVLTYLNTLKQRWCEDASNKDTAFTRNRIRHELLPMLRTFNPGIVDALHRVAEQAGEIHEEHELAARRLLEEAELPAAGEMRIFDAAKLTRVSRRRVRDLFRMLWEREQWPLGDMTFEHWKRLVAVTFGEETATDLPGGISARGKGKVIQVGFLNTHAQDGRVL